MPKIKIERDINNYNYAKNKMFDEFRYQWNLGMYDLYLRQLIELSKLQDSTKIFGKLEKAIIYGKRALELSEIVKPEATESIQRSLMRLEQYRID